MVSDDVDVTDLFDEVVFYISQTKFALIEIVPLQKKCSKQIKGHIFTQLAALSFRELNIIYVEGPTAELLKVRFDEIVELIAHKCERIVASLLNGAFPHFIEAAAKGAAMSKSSKKSNRELPKTEYMHWVSSKVFGRIG